MPTTDLDRCVGRLKGKLRRTARRWPVLPEGERLVLALSGGIDSLAMAYLVGEHNRHLQRPLEISGLHVRLDAEGVTRGLPEATRRWLGARGVEVLEVEARLNGSEELPLDCFACARARRRTLLEVADAHDASCVALGHHADDVVETWLLTLMYTGTAEVMPPVRSYFDGAVSVVRPLCELRRSELRRLARLAGFPKPVARCRHEDDARRGKMRNALSALGRDQELVRRQLYWAAMRDYSSRERKAGNGSAAEEV
jgi:tRNA 2-thiocytidine biosynthesis protein TtcA